MIEFKSDRIEQLQNEIARELGYDIVHHRLELYGRRRKVQPQRLTNAPAAVNHRRALQAASATTTSNKKKGTHNGRRRHRPDRPWRDGFQPRAQHRRERPSHRRVQPDAGANRRVRRKCRRAQGSHHPLLQHRRSRRRDPAAAPDHRAGAGRQARRRADRAAAPCAVGTRHHHRCRQCQFPRHGAALCGAFGQRPHLHRHGHLRRRGGRAPRPVDHGRRDTRIPTRASRAC